MTTKLILLTFFHVVGLFVAIVLYIVAINPFRKTVEKKWGYCGNHMV